MSGLDSLCAPLLALNFNNEGIFCLCCKHVLNPSSFVLFFFAALFFCLSLCLSRFVCSSSPFLPPSLLFSPSVFLFLFLPLSISALAYACLNAFINKYLCRFFCKDNSSIMQGIVYTSKLFMGVNRECKPLHPIRIHVAVFDYLFHSSSWYVCVPNSVTYLGEGNNQGICKRKICKGFSV